MSDRPNGLNQKIFLWVSWYLRPPPPIPAPLLSPNSSETSGLIVVFWRYD